MTTSPTITQLELARRSAGMSQTDLARAIGCHKTYLSRVEAGIERPSAKLRARIVEVLEPHFAAILFGEVD